MLKKSIQIPNGEIPFSEVQCNPIVKKINDCDIRSRIVLMQTIADNKDDQNIIFVTDDNRVYAFGENTEGCLGVGHCNPVWDEPVLIETFIGKRVIQIASGLLFTLVLCTSKECFSFGLNNLGQLCQGKEPSIVRKTLTKLYAEAGGAGGMPGGMPGGFPGASAGGDSAPSSGDKSGPTIEEVD